jgi:hypothetical protein
MNDFVQALEWLKAGYKVRRSSWILEEHGICFNPSGALCWTHHGLAVKITLEDITATDWKLVK